MKLPHPLVLEDLHRDYHRTHSRDDLQSWWVNATRHFDLLPQYTGDGEPGEVTAARALWVRANLDHDPQRRTECSAGCWLLVEPFTVTRNKWRDMQRLISHKK
ncbi:MAG TPA: hypothetical protein PK743_01480 [Luteimonas sp.]|nr:hypothetical protein [Luteimonas sp.]